MFSDLFKETDKKVWSSPEYLITTLYVGKIMDYGLRTGEISKEDLVGGASKLLAKLSSSDEGVVQINMKALRNIRSVIKDDDGMSAKPKTRKLTLKTRDGISVFCGEEHKVYKYSLITNDGRVIRDLI